MADANYGFLVARMEPANVADEAEFNDWYDFEHIPQRLAIPGFLSAQRYVAPQGWPRYGACYDLERADTTLSSPYKAETGHAFSAWSKRVLGRVHPGWSRLDMEQVYPGRQLVQSEWTGMTLLQFQGDAAGPVHDLAERLATISPLLQVRAFVGTAAPEPAAAIMLEAPAFALLPAWHGAELADRLGDLAASLRVSHDYTRYSRRDALVGVLSRVEATK
jgi:hypothetical protein